MAADESSETAGSKLVLLVVGAALTLVGTIVVQALIAPAVQARTRRLERWEENLRELFALLAEELPRATSRLHRDAVMDRMWREILAMRDSGIDFDVARQAGTEARTRERESAELIGQLASRLDLLFDRLRAVHPKAFEWIDLRMRVRLLGFKLLLFDGIGAAQTDEAADKLYSEQEEARKALLRQLTPLVDSQKPPPQWTARRLWNTNRARLRRLWSTNWARLCCLLKRARREDDDDVGAYEEEAMGGSSTGSRSSS